jgi:hypothetical protein
MKPTASLGPGEMPTDFHHRDGCIGPEQLASVLHSGGLINLIIPDKTRTFDQDRNLTTPAPMLEA